VEMEPLCSSTTLLSTYVRAYVLEQDAAHRSHTGDAASSGPFREPFLRVWLPVLGP